MSAPEIIGRYALFDKIASGGMASVYFGRLRGPVGFSRAVAIKRMHPQLAEDREFVTMFLDEANLAARIRHLNVVPTLDVVSGDGELLIVMEYVQGESFSRLLSQVAAKNDRVPVAVVAAILSGVLHGLHAAHEATSKRGEPLGIVHRDVSPQNIVVGVDGVARVLDFGVAKAFGRLQTTREGQLKGKPAYMAPEQIRGEEVTRRADVFAAAVVLWEALAGQRLFQNDNDAALMQSVLFSQVHPPSSRFADIPPELDAVVMRGLARDPGDRFQTALEMATALEAAVPLAIPPRVGEWVKETARDAIATQVALLTEIESTPSARDGGVPTTRRLGPSVTPTGPHSGPTRVEVQQLEGNTRSRAPAWTAPLAVVAATLLTLGVAGGGLWLLQKDKARTPATSVGASTGAVAMPSGAGASGPSVGVGHVEWRVTQVGGGVPGEAVEKLLRPLSCKLTGDYRTGLWINRGIAEGTATMHLVLGKQGVTSATILGMDAIPYTTQNIQTDFVSFAKGELPGSGWADVELTFRAKPGACSDADSNPSASVSFARDIRPLMNRAQVDGQPLGCTSCHDPTHPAESHTPVFLDLTTLGGLRKGGVVASKRMAVPGKPCESVLVQSLRGEYLWAPCRMPSIGPPYWSDAEIQLVMDWIAEGAKGGDEE